MTFQPNILRLFSAAAFIATVSALFCVPAVSFVSADESQLTARKLSDAGLILPLEKITKAAKTIKAGQILETELELKQGIYIYEVEILDNKSQVWELKLDAKTGKLIKLELED